MGKRLYFKFALFATAFFISGIVISQIWANPESSPSFINFTAAGEVLVSIDPLTRIFSAVASSAFALASLFVLIKRFLRGRNWKKKYGESRTPVVIEASVSQKT